MKQGWAITLAMLFGYTCGYLQAMPIANAGPNDCDYSVGYCGHQWNGPQRQTWDTPGFYGGQYGGNQLLCSPFNYACRGVSGG
jgi:hypothetical protein